MDHIGEANEMVERVAKAIWDVWRKSADAPESAIGVSWEWVATADPLRFPHSAEVARVGRQEACAAIAAMREPTEEQARRMDHLLSTSEPPTRRWHWIWHEMIDSILPIQPENKERAA